MSGDDERGAAKVPAVRSLDTEPDPAVLSRLRVLVERAEAGEVRGVVAVTLGPGGTAGVTWGGVEDVFRAVGALRYAERLLLDTVDVDGDPDE